MNYDHSISSDGNYYNDRLILDTLTHIKYYNFVPRESKMKLHNC